MPDINLKTIAMYNHDTVVRLPEENTVRIFSKHLNKSQIFHNLYIYTQIEESGLNVPKIKKVYAVDEERWGILEENIRGKTLMSEMFSEINEDQECYEEYLETLIELQSGIYKKKINGLYSYKSILEEQIQSLDILDVNKTNTLLKTLQKLPDDDKLIHGNFNPKYVITDENEIVYITEWTTVASGSPAADAAITYLNLVCISTEIAERYLKLFAEKTGYEAGLIRKWIPLAAASGLSMGAISMLQRTLLLTWLDVADNESLPEEF